MGQHSDHAYPARMWRGCSLLALTNTSHPPYLFHSHICSQVLSDPLPPKHTHAHMPHIHIYTQTHTCICEVFRQQVEIPMGTDYAPLLASLFLFYLGI